ncbi:glycosyl hydrolases family 18 domain-containing protein [Trichoderma breve]|nr:glycosyl hydrolases family 18 domain-containing protein [Trichoderma breve]KAJ4861242.1 glycosyl hydrolases family 18 domain-containing protein [Trichoderma breve]
MLALSMITRAGVNANKVVIGESSYGRSFRMAKTGCTGPDCTFTGANGQSDAAKGRCTNASGYLANAEINEIISKSSKSKKTWFDKDTASDYLVYNDVEWVAYMSDHTKEVRRDKWKQLNFGGSVDWAVDLQEFNGADTVGPHGAYDNSSCIQVFDNMIWDWLNPSIEAVVGCTNILQPSPLPVTVTLTAYTTITLQSGTSISTTVVSAPFSISEVDYQPFTFNESDIRSLSSGQMFAYNPTPRITPNPVTIPIPAGWTVTGIGKATKEDPSKEPSKSIIGLPQATSTTTSSHDGIGFLLPITWLPTMSYKIPSVLTPKPPAPTELPDDDEHPIVNPPTPPGVVDCKNDSCTKGQDCENDECLRGVEEIALVLIVNEEEFVKEKHATKEAVVLKTPPEAATLGSARAKDVSLGHPGELPKAYMPLWVPKTPRMSFLGPLVQRTMRPDRLSSGPPTNIQSLYNVTNGWSTTTRTQCEKVVDCDAADMTVTTTIKSSSEEPDPTYIAKVIGYEGMKLLRDEALFASIGEDEDDFFSLLESPTTTTSEMPSTSSEDATPEPTPEPTQTPEVTCGIALYPPIMWRLDIIDMTGSWVLDDEGKSLKKEIKGCGAVTGWEWFRRADGTLAVFDIANIMTATIKLYTNHGCPWAHRAHIALAELKIPFEEEIIDLSVPRTPEYLAINPRGLVPSLSYNGQIITESAIVAQFLADAYPSHLVPNGGTPEAALTRARINFFVDTFFSKVNSLYHKALFAKTDEEAEEAAAEFVKQLEKEVEPLLSDAAPYFGGSKTLTLAEVLTGSFILRLLSLPKNGVGPESLIKELPTKTPNFYKWATTVIEHPSVNGIWNEEKVVAGTKARLAKLKAA